MEEGRGGGHLCVRFISAGFQVIDLKSKMCFSVNSTSISVISVQYLNFPKLEKYFPQKAR